MPSVCMYFQVHQPFRVKRYSFFQAEHDHNYFDNERNKQICAKVADKCYVPTNKLLLKLIERYSGRFKIAYSITGVALEQMERYAPEALSTFVELAKTGCVEFLGETYYHSLSALYSATEFKDQVQKHSGLMKSVFGVEPKVFRNTELIYDDGIGRMVADLGFKAMIAEGVDDILDWRSPNYIYRHPESELRLLLKNYRLSDDIAFRFSNRGWNEFPLTAEKFVSWVHPAQGDTVNLFMDYETFGEHQWASTGIFQFLEHFPEYLLRNPHWNFATPSEIAAWYTPPSSLHFHRTTSWADVDRDLSAWRGNNMQRRALERIFALESVVRAKNDPVVSDIWRRLLTSDHFYYMCTKWFADGDVHAYFSPYDSPYDAFIYYMNVLRGFESHYLGIEDLAPTPPPP